MEKSFNIGIQTFHKKYAKQNQMKLFATLSLFLGACAFGGGCLAGKSCRPSVRATLKRKIRNAVGDHGQGLHSALERIMRTTLLQDISTYYAVILSGAETLSEVNEVLTKRDPHFDPLTQQELDILVDQWLFQMLSK